MRMSDQTEKLEAKADSFAHDAAASVRQTVDGLESLTDAALRDGRNGASRLARIVQKSSDEAVNAFRSNVKAQPSLMVGIAAGAGIILGLMMAGRR